MNFTNVDAGDGRAFIDYLDYAAEAAGADKSRAFAAQHLSPGMHVLDVGCGTGDDVRAIAEIVGADGGVVGIDSSRAMIDEAKARGVPSNVRFVCGSADTLPFSAAVFDAVRAERVFQHLNRPDAAARELKRVLKPGGSAFLLDQDWGSLMIAGAERAVTDRVVQAFCGHLANPWAGRQARGMLHRAGFTDIAFLPLVARVVPPRAFDSIIKPAVNAALSAERIDPETARIWLQSLLEAEPRGEFLCAVVVVVAMGLA